MTTSQEKARTIALTLLGTDAVATQQAVEQAVDSSIVAVRAGQGVGAGEIDRDGLVRDVESRLRVWVGISGVLDDWEGHKDWLPARRGQIEWEFWDRYRRYLEELEALPRQSVLRMEELTDRILARLEDPTRLGPWDRRGLVAGQVQSGKTANYIGLICKAADAGYRLIVVLAGIHNSLRSQTQLRVDQGFIGYDTQKRRLYSPDNVWIGAGQLPGARRPSVHSLTTSADKGDFSLAVARQAAVDIGGKDPVVLVVKKNKSILKNLIAWSTIIRQQRDPLSDRLVVPGVPLLLIDDEADHASINTSDLEESEPSVINGLVRELLARFEQSAYVGYTATPFANILIDPGADHPEFGRDLFPSSFIFTLRAPSNYIGPARVFGVEAISADVEGDAGLPLVRSIEDDSSWLPAGHRKDFEPGDLPDSLSGAIRSFLLGASVRRARGERAAHNSMLIHVTRYVAVQSRIAEFVTDEVDKLRRRLRFGDGAAPEQLRDELRGLWETDFVETSGAVQRDVEDPLMTPVAWSDVEPHLLDVAESVEVRRINGSARDALEYFERPSGLTVIAIGGDKLSRGLTLEGLAVSYFLRASRMYDTLLQMGRWFGYRPGYLDVCRLFLTPELRRWFGIITLASEELTQLFDHMVATGGTPSDFGLRIRSSPDGLTVTAPAKMRSGRTIRLSYSETVSETIVFLKDPDTVARNRGAVSTLLSSLAAPTGRVGSDAGTVLWRDVSPDAILAFLPAYKAHPASIKVQPKALAAYIESRVRDGELTNWTVALISNATGKEGWDEFADNRVGLIRRADATREFVASDRYDIKRLVSPADEMVDLSLETQTMIRALSAERQAAENGQSGSTKKSISGLIARAQRPPSSGLLLIYPLAVTTNGFDGTMPAFAISFPESNGAKPVEYTVNTLYWQQEFGQQEFEWDL